MEIKEAYKLLKLSDDASKEDVAEAYRKASKQSHPDIATGNNDEQKKINEARKMVLAYHDIRDSVVPVGPQALSRYIEQAVGRYAGPTSREKADRVRRRTVRPIQQAKWVAWGLGGLTGLMAVAEKLAPTFLGLDKNASESFKGTLAPVAAGFGLMGLVLQLVVSWHKNHTEATLDMLSDRRTCAEVLAQSLDFKDTTIFQEVDMRRGSPNIVFPAPFTTLLNFDVRPILLCKAIEHQLVAIVRPDEMTPGYTEFYELRFDPSLFRPPPPNPPTPTRPPTIAECLKGLGCAVTALIPTLGLASYLHFRIHTRWALLPLIFGTMIFLGAVIVAVDKRPIETPLSTKENTDK